MHDFDVQMKSGSGSRWLGFLLLQGGLGAEANTLLLGLALGVGFRVGICKRDANLGGGQARRGGLLEDRRPDEGLWAVGADSDQNSLKARRCTSTC